MKHFIKKALTTSICIALVFAVMTVGAFAANGQDKQRGGQGNAPNGRFGGGQSGGPGQNARRGNGVRDIAVALIEEKIAALDDEDTQEALTELLEAYEAAAAAEKAALGSSDTAKDMLETLRKATAAARSALADALADAGIEITSERPAAENSSRSASGDKTPNGFGGRLDTNTLANLIAEIDDEDTQDSLTALLKAYEAALAAEKAAFDGSSSQAAQDTLREATKAAADALVSALDDAGVEKSDYAKAPNRAGKSGGQGRSESSADSTQTSTAAEKSGVFNGILKWLSGLFE